VIGVKKIAELKNYLPRRCLGRLACVITNPKIKSLFAKQLTQALNQAGVKAIFFTVADGESSKSASVFFRLAQKVAKTRPSEDKFFIALGGGVVGDLTGFLASVYKRGVPYIQIPTTLLAQVDSAIGGKTALDLPTAKNLLGTFYQPALVFSEISFLEKLPARQLKTGLAEVIKYAVICDRKFFLYLEKNSRRLLHKEQRALEKIVLRASQIKAAIVREDEREKLGNRTLLNFGHTFAHAIEAASGYRSQRITHGEAVAIGMLVACETAEILGLAKKDAGERLEALLKKFGLPNKLPRWLKLDKILQAYRYDKKFIGGKNRLVLPLALGHAAVCRDIPEEVLRKALIKRVAG
jgi:3-dehydroquinate synthase